MSLEVLTETPMPVRCLACEHRWAPAVFLPMEARKFARVLRGLANCPRCGANGKRIVLDMDATRGAQGIVTGTAETSEALAPVPKGLEPDGNAGAPESTSGVVTPGSAGGGR